MESHFVFRGNACAAGGRITRIQEDNTERIIPVRSSVSLPVSGGSGKAAYKGYAIKAGDLDLLQTGPATAEATSTMDPKSGNSTTIVSAGVAGLNFNKVFGIDNVQAVMESSSGPDDSFPLIRTGDCVLTDLRLGERVVKVMLDLDTFRRNGKKADLQRFYAANPELRRTNYWQFNAKSPDDYEIPESKGIFVCSIVKGLKLVGRPDKNIRIDGYTIYWNNFGKIILGEILISELYRRLTLVRLSLGSPVEGEISIGEVETNGHSVP